MTSAPAYPEEAHGFQTRRAERVILDSEAASLNPDHVYPVAIRIENLSSCGFMAECQKPILIGSYVSLDVPGIGPVPAQIRWQIGTRMGGMFLDPISLACCEWTAEKADAA